MEQKDLYEVLKIYKERIDTGMATFQTEVPSEREWDEGHHAKLRLGRVLDTSIIYLCQQYIKYSILINHVFMDFFYYYYSKNI